ncbi:MAG: hypothetical protein RL120_03710 [Gammaproteobacteria bacterium]
MKLDQFTKLLPVYGPDLQRWPDTLGDSARLLLANDQQALALLEQEQKLAAMLDAVSVPDMPGLEHRVLSQALPPQPESRLDLLLNWLLPVDASGQWWRPALAATVPLIFGVVLGNFFSFGVTGVSEVQNWQEEMYLVSLIDYPDL